MDPHQSIVVLKLLIASILGFAMGWNRRSKFAGIRTFTLITLGSAIFTVIAVEGFPNNAATADHARIVAQIVSGIGFLGAGVIWKHGSSLTGLTTAAGIWVSSAVGIAVGVGMFLLAFSSTVLIIFIFHTKKYLQRFETHEDG